MSARRRLRGRNSNTQARRGWLLGVTLILLVVAGVIVVTRPWDRILSATTDGTRFSGTLQAEHNSHDLGRVPIGGGLVMAKFPLVAQGATLVTNLGTT